MALSRVHMLTKYPRCHETNGSDSSSSDHCADVGRPGKRRATGRGGMPSHGFTRTASRIVRSEWPRSQPACLRPPVDAQRLGRAALVRSRCARVHHRSRSGHGSHRGGLGGDRGRAVRGWLRASTSRTLATTTASVPISLSIVSQNLRAPAYRRRSLTSFMRHTRMGLRTPRPCSLPVTDGFTW